MDDCGGGYSESIAEMCDELQNGSVAILILTPNGREESGANRDCLILNPTLSTQLHQNMFRFFGESANRACRIVAGTHWCEIQFVYDVFATRLTSVASESIQMVVCTFSRSPSP